jgi:LPS export ABC transporter protein LptC
LVTSNSNTIELLLRRSIHLAFHLSAIASQFTLSLSKGRTLVRLVRYSANSTSLLVITILFLSSCENDRKAVEDLTKNVVLREEATNVETLFSQQGTMKAKLKAPLMIKVPSTDSPYIEFPNTLHADFYNDSTIIESWLDCKYAKYFESLNKVYLRDSVIVITIQGDTLKTPDLWWDQNEKIFYTDKYAEYYSTSKTIYGGKGLRATQDLRSVQFKYPTGTLKTEGSGFPQ